MKTMVGHAGIGEALELRKISGLATELFEWRADPETQQAHKEGGGVFDFVLGLRLAARLIYILRSKLKAHSLDANWGQIVAPDGKYLSPECDIVIHRTGEIDRWNGGGGELGNVMDFRFIKLEDVVAVISCKSFLTSFSDRDKSYCKRLKQYMRGKKLWLFAECVQMGKEKAMAQKAESIGHDRLWYLYSWDQETLQCERNKPQWKEFFKEIETVGSGKLRRRRRG